MSKFLKVMIVLLTIAAVATPVMAEDRLSLNGTMRVRGFNFDNIGYVDGADQGFFDQRFRLGGKIAVAEGVNIQFRTDITETVWGASTDPRPTVAQQWDRVFIELNKGMVKFRAGQQYFKLGNGIAFDNQGVGFTANIKTGAPVTLLFAREENIGTNNAVDYYGAQLDHATDSYSASIFAAGGFGGSQNDSTKMRGSSVYLIGFDAAAKLGMVDVKGEFDYFTGDYNKAASVDAIGMNLYLDASAMVSETVKLGGIFVYAAGTDKADEVQITRMGNGFNGWSPETYGPFSTDMEEFEGYIFDFTGDNAGVTGFQLYSDINVSDATLVTLSGGYYMPSEDKVTLVDSAYILNAGVDYKLMANTNVAAQITYTDVDVTGVDTKALTGAALRLQVAF